MIIINHGLPSILLLIIIDHPKLHPLGPLGDNDITHMAPLPIDGLETPHLSGGPGGVLALDVGIDELSLVRVPVTLEVGVVANLLEGADPLGAALDGAKQPVAVFMPGVVDGALLRGPFNPARGRLFDIDVCVALVVYVLLDVDRHAG